MKKLKRMISLMLCLIMAVSVAGLQISASADEQKTTVYKFGPENAAWSKTEGCNPNNNWAWGSFATTSFTYSEDGEATVNVTAGDYDKFRQFNSNWNNVPATTQSAYIDVTNNSTRTIKIKIATGGYTTPADADLPTVESGKTFRLELGTLTGGAMQIMLLDADGLDSIENGENIFKFSPIYIKVEKQPTVTIDGTEYESTDGSFTFPENNNADFVGYSDGEKLYASGETISVDKNITVTTMTLSLSMRTGAAVRYTDPSGLRFYTNIDTAQLNILETMGATVQLGTLVSRDDIIGKEALTFDMSGQILDIPYDAREWYTEGDFSGFVGSIVRFKEHNLNNKFAGRGYAKITLGEFSKTIYATYPSDDINNLLRSVCFVANSVKNDTAVYNALTNEQKTIIDNYVAKYVAE